MSEYNPKRFNTVSSAADHTDAEIEAARLEAVDENGDFVSSNRQEEYDDRQILRDGQYVSQEEEFNRNMQARAERQAGEEYAAKAAIESRIFVDANAQFMYMIAQDIARLRAKADKNPGDEQIIRDKEDNLEKRLEDYAEAHGHDESTNEILDFIMDATVAGMPIHVDHAQKTPAHTSGESDSQATEPEASLQTDSEPSVQPEPVNTQTEEVQPVQESTPKPIEDKHAFEAKGIVGHIGDIEADLEAAYAQSNGQPVDDLAVVRAKMVKTQVYGRDTARRVGNLSDDEVKDVLREGLAEKRRQEAEAGTFGALQNVNTTRPNSEPEALQNVNTAMDNTPEPLQNVNTPSDNVPEPLQNINTQGSSNEPEALQNVNTAMDNTPEPLQNVNTREVKDDSRLKARRTRLAGWTKKSWNDLRTKAKDRWKWFATKARER